MAKRGVSEKPQTERGENNKGLRNVKLSGRRSPPPIKKRGWGEARIKKKFGAGPKHDSGCKFLTPLGEEGGWVWG